MIEPNLTEISGEQMVVEGLKLTILGMGVVYVFLVALVFMIRFTAKLCAKSTHQECEALGVESAPVADQSFHLMAVISAAIKKHREK